MNIDTIIQCVVAIAPAVVSILTVISTMIVSIKKIKNSSQETVNEVKSQNEINEELKEQLVAVTTENAELKKEIRKCMNKMNHVAETKDVKR